ncbi:MULTISPECIES: ricin-type beta-trefoil lectin domain protein [unclassified Nocardia]|uniref:ricin-type beta-trefoil lectin domain protein n=1 Tax=Nocardia sp. NPDC058114 TaxID=3346346 RepID=UPI0036DE449D
MKNPLSAGVVRAGRNRPERSARRLVGLLGRGAVVAAAAMMVFAPASSAGAGITMPNGLNERVCLDALTRDGRTLTGVVQVWACNNGAQQRWIPGPNGSLRNALDERLCLDALTRDGRTLTGVVQVWACNGGAQQRWIAGPSHSLRNGLNDRLCLDALTTNGHTLTGRVQVWSCNNGAQQQW